MVHVDLTCTPEQTKVGVVLPIGCLLVLQGMRKQLLIVGRPDIQAKICNELNYNSSNFCADLTRLDLVF